MRDLVNNRWFALTDLFLVMISAAAWMLFPRFGIGFSLIAFLPWLLRFLAGYLPFQRTPFDWLIAIFLVTAWVGYWAAYDETAAWTKYWLLVSAVLFYFALSAQPRQNLITLSFLSFSLVLALSIYFCLTYDFTVSGGRLAIWWASHRPRVDWPPIDPDYVSGLVLIGTLWALLWLWTTGRRIFGSAPVVIQAVLLSGIGLVVLVFALTLSRAIAFLGLGLLGLWVLWKVWTLTMDRVRVRATFPVLVLVYLIVLIALAYLGQANAIPGSLQSNYGRNSRAEVLGRASYFLADYPITGAGLASFPGLYSQYVLVIPYPFLTESYNTFLDVGIEQGIIAGVVLLFLYLSSVFLVSWSIANDPSRGSISMRWLTLSALFVAIVHGCFYDYLYNGNGTALLFYPLGMAMAGVLHRHPVRDEAGRLSTALPRLKPAMVTFPVLALILMLGMNFNRVISYWYSNLGALQMSKAELKDFPANQWATSDMAYRLEPAESTLRVALQYEPQNETANYRLGLISMMRQDFQSAVGNLQLAYQEAPKHRGIIKNLGYAYAWLGEFDKAQLLLSHIPEAQKEMGIYIGWWDMQGRPDLSQSASIMVSRLTAPPQ